MINSFEPITVRTKKGKIITRYDSQIQKSNGKFSANVNIGVTPKGTRYYRALLPDKSWGSLYMLKKDGSEVIVDSCSSANGVQASVLNKNNEGIIKSDRFIEHMTNRPTPENILIKDRMVGQTSKTFIQDDVKRAINYLTKSFDMFKTPPKPGFWKRFWKAII